jgi:hypothetical protein
MMLSICIFFSLVTWKCGGFRSEARRMKKLREKREKENMEGDFSSLLGNQSINLSASAFYSSASDSSFAFTLDNSFIYTGT